MQNILCSIHCIPPQYVDFLLSSKTDIILQIQSKNFLFLMLLFCHEKECICRLKVVFIMVCFMFCCVANLTNIRRLTPGLLWMKFLITGIGVLIGRYKKMKDKNIPIFITNPSSHAEKIFKITGLYSLMPKIV